MIFDRDGQALPKFPKSKLVMSLQYLKKEVRNEVDFLQADKHQSWLEVEFNTSGIKVSYNVILLLLMGMIKHPQSTQSNKFLIFLRISKKELAIKLFKKSMINTNLLMQ